MSSTKILSYLIILLFISIPIILSQNFKVSSEEICPFRNTINLTKYKSNENGSYLYENILIPVEKQHFYNYNIKYGNKTETVPVHLRGCTCENKPCIKLCCERDEYIVISLDDESICKKFSSNINISWQLPLQIDKSKTDVVDILEYFTPQVGLPCRYPEIYDPDEDKYIMLADGNVTFEDADDVLLNTLDYCYSHILNDATMEYALTLISCSEENIIPDAIMANSYAMGISVIFLIPTILVYLVLKELRGNLRGKLVISYLSSMAVGYFIISLINTTHIIFPDKICKILGFTCYFFFMSTYLWLSVFCYDICRHFKETNIELRPQGSQMKFLIYCLYVWSVATIATGIAIYIQLYTNINDNLKPGIGDNKCWLKTEKWSAAIYFYGPNLLILLLNCATFIHITIKIYKVRRGIGRATNNDRFFQENAIVICRLFLIMGISWIFDILSYCLRDYQQYSFLLKIADFFNAIQGLLIFLLFVIKRNVLNLLKKRFFKQHNDIPQNNCNTTGTNLSKMQSSSSTQGHSVLEPLNYRRSTISNE